MADRWTRPSGRQLEKPSIQFALELQPELTVPLPPPSKRRQGADPVLGRSLPSKARSAAKPRRDGGRWELRAGLVAAAALLLVFVGIAVVTVHQRSELERRITESFTTAIEERSPTAGDQSLCRKLETYHFRCLVGKRKVPYDLTYVDGGCWRAVALAPPKRAEPERLRGCLRPDASTTAAAA